MINRFKTALLSGLLVITVTCGAGAQSINAGSRQAESAKPFAVREIASFDTPWAIAFLPDGRLLVTEKPGAIFLVTQSGRKTPVGNVPAVAASGQNGLLDIAPSPRFQSDRQVYLTYVEPGAGGSSLALARATLAVSGPRAELEDLKVIWRQMPKGSGGQPGGIIAFDPSGQHLFLTSGDRMRPSTAQDPDQALGKVLRFNLDGTTPSDNPHAADGGVRAQTWTMGHRNPYGLAFAPNGQLWLHEMGPRGGDEFNRIEPGKNYGWPEVSNGDNYNGTPIPRHATRPEFAAPPLYWNPVIAPAGLAFYQGTMFPAWQGSALIGGLASMGLVRVTLDGKGGADEVDRWDLGARIRDVAVAPDGAVWVIEDDSPGRLVRLTPL
ncbi:PQQ-dependent sugar dehydrogenase [Neorhizobium alkalisoli]|uniref:Glucose/arabinose dehydrogenase n=1 Tax=Neorhizobium alkalisoli TaxID=528178 RepID=A0A561R7Y9_9HYPH|nr:PQQ-dependent sugar dehydrogenase [Neorhizobium alkalisoli]TWF58724.1 glucose/arabinose dehydrogenase [Neorhizobium alkalisoli]